ncbi:hypothetical protein [Synechococcus phage Yong-M3-232]|nr:hypothetical protein [Synechococcus phage Yong-M3-232]
MMDWLDTHFVPEWRDSWRWASVQTAAVASAVGGTIAASPDLLLSLTAFLPDGPLRWGIVATVVLVMFVVPTVARLWRQGDDAAE